MKAVHMVDHLNWTVLQQQRVFCELGAYYSTRIRGPSLEGVEPFITRVCTLKTLVFEGADPIRALRIHGTGDDVIYQESRRGGFSLGLLSTISSGSVVRP